MKCKKNDAADADAICEAVTRPMMRFVPIKTAEQQSVLMVHRARLERIEVVWSSVMRNLRYHRSLTSRWQR